MTRTPQETFLSDQVLALGRDMAADPRVLTVVVSVADGKSLCTWCDCPDGPDSPHNQSGYRCAGCPDTARHMVSTFAGPNERYDYPACEQHKDRILEALATMLGAQL